MALDPTSPSWADPEEPIAVQEPSASVEEPLAAEPGSESAPELDLVPPEPEPVSALPVESAERVGSVDVLRGLAVLGILAMNIVDFAWPRSVYAIPIMDPDAGRLDNALWALNHLLFDTKMMTLFSMLFGAGLVLMADRAEGRNARWRGIYYRRVTWLLVIGLVHSYLIWDGDILVLYATCGFLLYPFRRLSPRTLIVAGLGFSLVFVPLLLGFRFGGVPYMRNTAARVDARVKAGQKPGWWEQKVHEGWKEMSKSEMPKREDFLKAVARRRESYPAIVKSRAGSLIFEHTIGFLLGGWWLAGGRMLIGMGLMKLGVFSARLSSRTYGRMMLVGYGVGLPLMAFDAYHQLHNGFFLGRRLWYFLDGWPFLTLYGSLFVVAGHVGAVMLVCQSGLWTGLTRRLAAVGRMALSNYLFDSILFTTLFYGYGFDLFGAIHRPLLYLIVLATWTFQLLASPLWLEHFRYGPAEWLWRSLTYWKLQPLLARPSKPIALAPMAA